MKTLICNWTSCNKEFVPTNKAGKVPKFCSASCRTAKNLMLLRRRRKQKMVDYKGGRCSKCGYNKCLDALSFHHLDPQQKSFTISKIKRYDWELIKKELDKCELLCANCHSESHYKW